MILAALVLVFKSTLILESSEFSFSYNVLFILCALKPWNLILQFHFFLPSTVDNLEYRKYRVLNWMVILQVKCIFFFIGFQYLLTSDQGFDLVS